ncbi:hypothetical protein FWF93_00835 [Candidatus Saccharibacteria bacterium]|jgi:ribosomal protein L37AE/L43A|nr:hypothetical protein [Candidatus Saccharibacteria bacterium]
MPSKTLKIIADFPEYKFVKGSKSFWLSPKKVIFYNSDEAELLHEIAHAILKHTDFTTDADLIRKERAAWTKAKELALKYGVAITDAKIEKDLDSYRDWLHFKSTCPDCSQNGVQSVDTLDYRCFACNTSWRVNHNQHKRVRRTKITPY